ncbi:hypothetical protein NJB1907E39_47540 [Mycobacterium marinum]|nr:hypothetical protein NJB1907E39_47540 [Mycobacterium marinum]
MGAGVGDEPEVRHSEHGGDDARDNQDSQTYEPMHSRNPIQVAWQLAEIGLGCRPRAPALLISRLVSWGIEG